MLGFNLDAPAGGDLEPRASGLLDVEIRGLVLLDVAQVEVDEFVVASRSTPCGTLPPAPTVQF